MGRWPGLTLSFCSDKDRSVLWDIFARVYGQQKKPQIFTSKFLPKRHYQHPIGSENVRNRGCSFWNHPSSKLVQLLRAPVLQVLEGLLKLIEDT